MYVVKDCLYWSPCSAELKSLSKSFGVAVFKANQNLIFNTSSSTASLALTCCRTSLAWRI